MIFTRNTYMKHIILRKFHTNQELFIHLQLWQRYGTPFLSIMAVHWQDDEIGDLMTSYSIA